MARASVAVKSARKLTNGEYTYIRRTLWREFYNFPLAPVTLDSAKYAWSARASAKAHVNFRQLISYYCRLILSCLPVIIPYEAQRETGIIAHSYVAH